MVILPSFVGGIFYLSNGMSMCVKTKGIELDALLVHLQ